MYLGARVKKAREAMGLSQMELAGEVEISQSAIKFLENGTRCPTFAVMTSIAARLNVSLDWLAGMSEDAQIH